ncbi:GAF and ANTAR domain-containing protein [Streptomyces somaliensis]|uniref:ANTAR domain-containing response regulator n=1 Tax=Streptomyces somaliensis TaxID=78355 RepID=UPI0020CF96D4|nr:GAF and ANTAR domain-containing protein [Streptomyces somaliensis]MCP9943640.1 GAF and ANTAR domain-containing protein [Streptomyces somaliensis]MCP9963112.1 GAF and ANTAR domain-containing protein [Streptomyces somaliensis]MCP9975962.1 GAF and ANTAR domain-containing protein [Streptomyces somaliensis]
MPIEPEYEGTDSAFAVRRLQQLAEQCVRSLPACCGAVATLGDEEEQERDERRTTATHPDLAALVSVQLDSGDGPIRAALDSGEPVIAGDLLHDDRWPAYRAAALAAGVRSSVTLPFHHAGVLVTLNLYGFRPGALANAARGPAAVLGEEATEGLVRDRRYRAALTEVGQLETALRSRPVIDQAGGIVVHVLGCGVEEAYAVLRRVSQLTNRKLSDVAAQIVRSRGRGLEKELARLAPPPVAPRSPNGEPS